MTAKCLTQGAMDVMLQGSGQPVHSLGCAWCECIAVKHVKLSDSYYDQIQALIVELRAKFDDTV